MTMLRESGKTGLSLGMTMLRESGKTGLSLGMTVRGRVSFR